MSTRRFVAIFRIFDFLDGITGHQANVERIAVILGDKALSDIVWPERVMLGRASGNTERHFGIVSNGPAG